jgi:hypothetical protein
MPAAPNPREDVSLDPLRRRALINGGIATAVTLVVGFGILAGVQALDDGSAPAPVSPSPTATTPPPPVCTPVWEIVQSANPGDLSNWLSGVTVLSSSEAWAVGGSGDPAATVEVLIERWDGIAWSAEEGPSPGSQRNELRAVDAVDPNDVWAVGRMASGFGDRPLVVHYDGTEWLDVPLPDEVTGVLNGVAAVAADDVWAIGYTGDPALSLEHALILHWDGQLWAVVEGGRAVGSGRSALQGVQALAPDDVWGVGYLHNQPLIIHFDGEDWSRSETEVGGVTNAIEPLTLTDAWAVGAPIQRFDGTTWAEVAGVRNGGELTAVAAIGPSDLWAVGLQGLKTEGLSRALVLRFDGRRWTAVEGATIPGSDALTGADALADGTVLAVGYRDVEAGRRTLAISGTTCPPPS